MLHFVSCGNCFILYLKNNNRRKYKNPYLVCDKQTYALCTSAPCFPDPADSLTTICLCDIVKEVTSLNTLPLNGGNCSDLQPFTKNGLTYIYSTYSNLQAVSNKTTENNSPLDIGDRKFMSCDTRAAWSNCIVTQYYLVLIVL